jgi:hypothetical protein
MALRFEDSLADLKWISDLPGKKVIIKGNHDLWWNSVSKLNALFENMYFLQNTFYEAEGAAICGSRGWACPGDDDFTEQDRKIYLRELGRLRLSLEAAANAGYGKKPMGERKLQGKNPGRDPFSAGQRQPETLRLYRTVRGIRSGKGRLRAPSRKGCLRQRFAG